MYVPVIFYRITGAYGGITMGKSNIGIWIVLLLAVILIGGIVMNFVTAS